MDTAPNNEISLVELSERSGVPGRTIRLYIAEGLLPGPLRAGRNAAYGPEHVRILEEIRRLQRKGLTLSQIRRQLSGESAVPARVEGDSWRQFVLSPDVQVWVREDLPAWRGKVIRDAMAQFGAILADAKEKENIDE